MRVLLLTMSATLLLLLLDLTLAVELLEWGVPLEGTVDAGAWHDYYVDAADDDANLYFEVLASSSRADALGLYVSEGELKPASERTTPGAFLDFDETSMIAHGTGEKARRKFSVAVSQCYVQAHTRYYLSVRGGKAEAVGYTVSAQRVPARIPLNGTVSGSLCDNRYLHYFWELPATPTLAGVRTTLRKTSGELDAFFMRYERCAGPIGTNLERVSVDGHGVASRSVALPRLGEELTAGRYYVSVKGQPELCGSYEISPMLVAISDMTLAQRSAAGRGAAPAAAAAAALAVAGGWLARRRRSPV